jgi:Tol biopolymer transport system component
MNTDHDVRELLERMAREPAIGPVDPEPMVRRAHRRLARTAVLGFACVAVLAGVAIGGANLVLSSPSVPATPNPEGGPNGDIAFLGSTAGTVGDLVVVDPNGGQVRTAVPGCTWYPKEPSCPKFPEHIRGVTWSPDGERLAYSLARIGSPQSDELGIYVFDLGSQTTTRITTCSKPCTEQDEPDWSPDGSRIAFTEYRGASYCYRTLGTLEQQGPVPPGSCRIVTIAPDGTDRSVVDTGSIENPVDPSWSPDGARIAFSARTDEGWLVYVTDGDGSEPVALTDDHPSNQPTEPAWSPEGTQIAFALFATSCDTAAPPIPRCGDLSSELWTVAPDGSNARFVADLGCCIGRAEVGGPGPEWSPDGSRIAVAVLDYPTTRLLVLNLDGTVLADLGETSGPPAWQPRP